MKFFLWIFGSIIVAFIAFVLLYHFNENKGDFAKSFNESMQAKTIQETRPKPTPVNSDPNAIPQRHTDALSKAATNAGVTVNLIDRNRNEYQVMVTWKGDRMDLGAVFLDDLLEQGLLTPDFEEVVPFTSGVNQHGERMMQVGYKLRLR